MSYAGDITPEEAWKLLSDDPDAVLVDCPHRRRMAVRRGARHLGAGSRRGVRASGIERGRTAQREVRRRPDRGRRQPGDRPGGLPVSVRQPLDRRRESRHRSRYRAVLQRAGRLRGPPRRGRAIAVAPVGAPSACPGGSRDRQSGTVGAHPAPLPDGVSQATIGVRGGLLRSGFEETAEALYLTSGYVYSIGRRGREGVHRRDRPLRLLALRQPDHLDVRGAAAADRGRAGVLRDGDGHGRGVHVAGRAAGRRRPAGRRAQPVRLVLRGVQRDPAALGRGDGVRRRRRPRRSGRRRCRSRRRRCSSRRRRTRCSRWSTSPRSAELAHAAGAKVVLDNVFATPLLQQGFPLGADVVVYSGTKHIDGQGRVLGGAILGDKEYIDGPVQKLMRHTGPAISPLSTRGCCSRGWRRWRCGWTTAPPRRCGSRSSSKAIRRCAGCATRSWSRTRSTTWPSGR